MVVALAAPAAHAAAPSAIHRDAADGTIDGTYTLDELRSADRSVSTEQREYYGWDDVYGAHIRGLTAPKGEAAEPGVAARDRGGRSVADAPSTGPARSSTSDRADAAVRTSKELKSPKDQAASVRDEEPTTVSAAGAAAPSAARTDANVFVSSLWAFALLPLLVIGAGVWRGVRGRRRACGEDSSAAG